MLSVHACVKNELRPLIRFINRSEKHRSHADGFFWEVHLPSAFDQVTFHAVVRWPSMPLYVRSIPCYFFHEDGGLIQGAPASPSIFQFLCQRILDPYIDVFCQENGIAYTRLMNRLLFSSNRPIKAMIRKEIKNIISFSGFNVDDAETSSSDPFQTIPNETCFN